nr:histidinol-phosphate transaminase [uncultured Cellulosilyticum sp.]
MRFLRPRFRDLKPYHSAYVTEGVILNANESPYKAPEGLVQHMQKWLSTEMLSCRYPDTDSLKLSAALADNFGVDVRNIVCGVGSDELIDCILSSTIENDDKVMMPYPSFSMYAQFSILNSASLIKVPLTADFTYDVAAFIESVQRHQPKVIFICNPNNPTGCIMAKEDIKRILEVAKGLVVVDEAYAEFDDCKESAIPFIKEYSNLIVLKTFSKAYALAGARVGYGIACSEVIDLINTVRVPYNLSIFSQEAAFWAIANKALYKENITKIIAERSVLEKGLQALGIKTYPSHANFIWCELKAGIFEALEKRQIYIRKMNVEDKPYYRITVGTPAENQMLLKALKEMETVL